MQIEEEEDWYNQLDAYSNQATLTNICQCLAQGKITRAQKLIEQFQGLANRVSYYEEYTENDKGDYYKYGLKQPVPHPDPGNPHAPSCFLLGTNNVKEHIEAEMLRGNGCTTARPSQI